LNSCDALKSEDDKIRNVLIGKFFEEDDVTGDGSKIKNVKGEFYSDGRFRSEATLEILDDETYETIDITFKLKGDWSVKDKFIYYTYDYNSIVITPELYMFMKDDLIQTLKDKNTPDKVIEYDASKIIYEDSDGERHTKKKSY
jgi:hypothetical protein